jgi:hypothetical protein
VASGIRGLKKGVLNFPPYNGIRHLVELSSIEDHIKYIVPGLYDATPSIQVNKLIAESSENRLHKTGGR